jgi:hypothetical protein
MARQKEKQLLRRWGLPLISGSAWTELWAEVRGRALHIQLNRRRCKRPIASLGHSLAADASLDTANHTSDLGHMALALVYCYIRLLSVRA